MPRLPTIDRAEVVRLRDDEALEWVDVANRLECSERGARKAYREQKEQSQTQPTQTQPTQPIHRTAATRLPDPSPAAGGPTLPDPHPQEFRPFDLTDTPGQWLVISDIHLPYHDKRTIELAVAEAERRDVVGVFLNGDVLDSHEISDHEKDRDAPSYKDELDMGRQFLSWLRSRRRRSRIIYKQGNHEDRLERYVAKRAPALGGIDGINLPSFLKMDDVGVEWVEDKRVITMGKLYVIHGHEYKQSLNNPVSPARGLYLKARRTALVGHMHRSSEWNGRAISMTVDATWSLGCACFLHPKYSPINDWNHGFAFVHVESSGDFVVENKRVINGKMV